MNKKIKIQGIDVSYKVYKNKVHLIYIIPFISQGCIIDHIKILSRYRIITNSDIKLIPPKEKFVNKISMKYSVKKKKLKFNYSIISLPSLSKDITFIKSLTINDLKFYREFVINKIL